MKNILIATLTVMLLAACSTSKITTSWKAAGVPAGSWQKIMVLGLIRETDRSLQQKMEDHFAGDLKQLGYNAVSALQQYGPGAFEGMDEEAAIAKIRGSGVDAVMTIVLLDKEKEQKYVPGNIYYTPYRAYYSRFWGYRTVLYRRIYEPGYYVTDTRYFWESNLYDMGNQQLIYSVQTRSFDPGVLNGWPMNMGN